MSADLDAIAKLLETLWSGISHINRRRVTIGLLDSDSNLTNNATTGLPDCYVWVFDQDADAATRISFPVKNLTTEYAPGAPVKIAYSLDDREDQVISIDQTRAPQMYGSAAAGLNSPPKSVGTFTAVQGTDIVTGGLYPSSTSGGLYVVIQPFQHLNGCWTGSTELELTPTTTAYSKALNCVGIDIYTNDYVEVLTQDRSMLSADLYSQDCYDVIRAYPSVIWIGAVELSVGNTTINPNRIVDLRLWRTPTALAQTGALITFYRQFH